MLSTLDSFNPQQPQYKELKAALARASKNAGRGRDQNTARSQRDGGSQSAKEDAILANMERWRWLREYLSTAYVIVNIPDYILTVVNNGKPLWSTRIVVGQPGKRATPLLAETIKYITFIDVECAAFHYQERISSCARARPDRTRADWPEDRP